MPVAFNTNVGRVRLLIPDIEERSDPRDLRSISVILSTSKNGYLWGNIFCISLELSSIILILLILSFCYRYTNMT